MLDKVPAIVFRRILEKIGKRRDFIRDGTDSLTRKFRKKKQIKMFCLETLFQNIYGTLAGRRLLNLLLHPSTKKLLSETRTYQASFRFLFR